MGETVSSSAPSSEYAYEGKADVVYLQVTLCDPHLSAQWPSYTDDIGAIQVHFLSFPFCRSGIDWHSY